MTFVFQTILPSDDPNAGKDKINSNFSLLANFSGATGSTPYVGSPSGAINTVYGSNISTGNFSVVAGGQNNQALGDNSHAEGYQTSATGNSSHAEGDGTISSGEDSHSEGFSTNAIGNYSHAQGFKTTANGEVSHAEGNNSISNGSSSHAEGFETVANGDNSHAEGHTTTSSGNASHSEGNNTQATGDNSHAAGNSSIAQGLNSFIHSNLSTTSADNSSIIGGTGNILTSGATGSTILGGSFITGSTSNTVYGVNFNASGTIYSGGTDLGTIISSISSGSGGSPIYTGASATTVTVNQIPLGTNISGVSLSYLLENIYAPFVAPTFSSFVMSGQATTVEAGTTINAGTKTFTWTTTTPGNINSNTITIKDQTLGANLATGLANTGSDSVSISAVTFTGITSQTYRILGTPSQGSQIQRDFTINSYYSEFYGAAASVPTGSTGARSLSSSRFTSSGNVFLLATGTVYKSFVIVLPTAKTIVSIIDTNTNIDLTASFILTNFSVNDVGGNPYTANCYSLTQAVPFSVSHNLQITTN